MAHTGKRDNVTNCVLLFAQLLTTSSTYSYTVSEHDKKRKHCVKALERQADLCIY